MVTSYALPTIFSSQTTKARIQASTHGGLMFLPRRTVFPSHRSLIAFRCAAWIVATACIVLGSIASEAQTDRGSVIGRVTDSSGAALPGAQVTLEPSGAA